MVIFVPTGTVWFVGVSEVITGAVFVIMETVKAATLLVAALNALVTTTIKNP